MPFDISKWKDNEKEITSYCLDLVNKYHGSVCYSALKKNCISIRKSRDLDFNTTPAFDFSIGIPWVLPEIYLKRAIISQAFRPDYLFYLTPLGNTSYENAKKMEEVLNINTIATRFKETTFSRIIDSLASYGCSVCYSEIHTSKSNLPRTIADETGMIRRVENQKVKTNAINKYIHILDYGQDPDVAEPDFSSYQFFIDRQYLYDVWNHYQQNPTMYDESAMQWVYEQTKKGNISNPYYHLNAGVNKHSTMTNNGRGIVDLIRIYTKLPISGNEGDDTDYEVIITGERIISITKNNNENQKRMLTVVGYYQREEYWWSVNEALILKNHENIANIMLQMKANNAIESMNYKIFYPEGIVDMNGIQGKKYVPYQLRMNEDIRKMLYQFQPLDQSVGITDSFMSDIRESAQEINPKPDFTRTPKQGGIGNQAAAAINMVGSMQNTKESDVLERISYGLSNIGLCNYLLLQQYLENKFQYRPDKKSEPVDIYKDEIMGEFFVNVATSLTENKLIRLQNLQNNLTFFLNAMGSGHPDLQRVPLMPIIKEIIRNTDIGGEKEIMDTLNAQQQQPFSTEQQPNTQMPPQGALV